MRSLSEMDLAGKKVLLRLDLNVPLDSGGGVADDTRIRASLPTISWITSRGGRAILLSHLGRPKGKPDPRFSLQPVAARLTELLERPVPLAPGITGPEVQKAVDALSDGDCILLENIRFHPGEKAGADDFIRELSLLGESYVNDAFGTCHRGDASVAGIPGRLPSAAGLLVQKEIETLGQLLQGPEHPFVAVLGGAKVTDKVPVIAHLLPRADRILIGGGMAYTFLLARGEDVGASLVDRESLGLARSLLEDGGSKILLPRDHRIRTAGGDVATVETIPGESKALDIGPATLAAFREVLGSARTVVWNGPLGVFEEEPFADGTRGVVDAVAALPGALTVAGGGETVAAIRKFGEMESFSHVSTGGGAFLEFISGKTLPGVAALEAQDASE